MVFLPCCNHGASRLPHPQTIFLRNLTVDAAKAIPDNSLDFVYVDAR